MKLSRVQQTIVVMSSESIRVGTKWREWMFLTAMAWASTCVAGSLPAALERPALHAARPAQSVMQGAAFAGSRIVAVGERGIVILSDDRGNTWKQVSAPVSVGLTAVRFANAQYGWIVGHGGVVLATRDGGETWTKQFDGLRAAALLQKAAQVSGDAGGAAAARHLVEEGADKPLMDAHFFDERHGIIVGAYNLAFETTDGGAHWQPISNRLNNPQSLHLHAVRARGDEVVIVGEQGLVLRSTDGARSFVRLNMPYKGSYFVVEIPEPRRLIVAGLRGNAWSSNDGGDTWRQVNGLPPVAITASTVDSQGRVWLGNLAGMLFSVHGGEVVQGPKQLPPLTGLLPMSEEGALAATMSGVVSFNLRELK